MPGIEVCTMLGLEELDGIGRPRGIMKK